METEDRREYQRVPFIVPVNVSYNRNTLKGYWTRDVSEGGLRLEFLPIPIASTFKLIVPIGTEGDAQHFVVDAEVVWRSFKTTGIRFVNPPDEVLEFIRRTVRQLN
jgi:hypothetical protein